MGKDEWTDTRLHYRRGKETQGKQTPNNHTQKRLLLGAAKTNEWSHQAKTSRAKYRQNHVPMSSFICTT